MRPLSKLLAYLSGPILLGTLVAMLIMLFFPERFNLPLTSWLEQRMATPAAPVNTSAPYSYAHAVNRAAPSVVNIYTLKEQPAAQGSRFNPLLGRYSNQPARILPTTGSGVIVSDEGYIITNLHVVESPRAIRVALQDGREAEPRLIGFSEEDDMAVLKIDLDNLQAIEIGDPDAAQVGDVVLAIGNPFGVGQTVTQGIVSGTRRKGLNIAHYENFIQTDAAINPGNSGGALVDAQGRLLGINIGDLRQTYYGDASGIGFAIPADRAVQALVDIVEHGRVVRGWLGVSAVDLNPQVIAALGLSTQDGVLITDIYQNGPADLAGLVAGDVITAINGNQVSSMSGAIQEFANLRPGDIITLDITRGQDTAQLEAVLTAEPQQP